MSKFLKDSNEHGFITLIIFMAIIIGIVVGLAYIRVNSAQR